MTKKFASLEHSATHGYAYDSEAWSGNAPVVGRLVDIHPDPGAGHPRVRFA